MKSLRLTVALLLAWSFLQAQDSTQTMKEPIRFQNILQVGLLLGESQSEFEIQSINGIKWKTFSGGIGIGVDNYFFRTVPLFIDLRTDILKKQNTPFVFADAGMQFPWVQNAQKSYNIDPEYKSGFYFNAGAGYKINMLKRNAIVFSAAFSLKKVDETGAVCGVVSCTEPNTYEYTFRRLSLKIGWTVW